MEIMEDATGVERKLLKKASEKRIPINGSIELLPLCNMNCDMCYVRLSKEEMEKQGRLRTCDEWIEIAKQMQKEGTMFLLLTGGEPLLYPDFKKLYLELRNLGMIITINTNGTLIDEEWASFFGKYKPRRINITLYGADEKAYEELCHYPGGFHKVLKAVNLLKKYKVDVLLGVSLTKKNKHHLNQIFQITNGLNTLLRVDTYMMPSTRERNKPYAIQSRLDPISAAQARIKALKYEMGEDLFKNFVLQKIYEVEHILPEKGPGKVTCLAGNCSFTINWQGNMRPCVISNTPSISVIEHGFHEAWKRMCAEIDIIKTSSTCNSCNLRPICRTCSAAALLETGKYEGIPNYMCQYAKESLRLLYIELRKYVEKEIKK